MGRAEVSLAGAHTQRGVPSEDLDVAKLSISIGIRGFVGEAVLAAELAGNLIENIFEIGVAVNEECGSAGFTRELS